MTGKTGNNQEFLRKLNKVTEANIGSEKFGVSELAQEMSMSRSNLHRKVHAELKISVSRYLRQKRLEKGLELLRRNSLNVSEAALESGFGSVSYFIKCFHDYYGYPPGEVEEVKGNDTPGPEGTTNENRKTKKWMATAGGVVFLIISLLFVNEISYMPQQNMNENALPEEYVAVAALPLHFEGSDSMKLIAGGFRGSILNRLMEIETLILRSETSVEQYRESVKPLKKIAEELNADFIIEMKGFQSGNDTRLQVSLADAVNDEYIWRAAYPIDVNEKNSLDLPNRIAREILKNTNTEISTREREILQERVSENPAALNYFLQAIQHRSIARQTNTYRQFDESYKQTINAKVKLQKAIMLDSGFTSAYIRLGSIYIDVLQNTTNDRDVKHAILDSGFLLVEKALSFYDQQLKDRNYRWALFLKSNYYYYRGDLKKSAEIYEQMKTMPVPLINVPKNTSWKSFQYNNYFGCIQSFLDYHEIIPENEIIEPQLYTMFCNSLFYMGFPKVAENYLRESLANTGDTLDYYSKMAYGHLCTGNYAESINYAKKFLARDSTAIFPFYFLMNNYIFLKKYKQAYAYAAALEKKGQDAYLEVTGFIHQKMGNEQKASHFFTGAKEMYLAEIDAGTLEAAKYQSHFNLAWTYSALGEKEQALKYLEKVNNRTTIPYWFILNMNDWPLFGNIRNEPEFQRLKKEFMNKYQNEHDRVAELLRKKGKIPLTAGVNKNALATTSDAIR